MFGITGGLLQWANWHILECSWYKSPVKPLSINSAFTQPERNKETHTETNQKNSAFFIHDTNTNTLPNARGQMGRKGKWGSFVHSEFRSWPLNKLALQRWAALTMMYGRNTIHCCYELVGSGADKACTCAQIHTDRHPKQVHRHTDTKSRGSGRANSCFLSSRQIQFSSRTYVSWLKQPTKTGEICHILQDWTQYWVLLWQWDASSPSPSLSF